MFGLSAETALTAAERLAAVSVAISSAEYLVRPGVLTDRGLGSWAIGQLERRLFISLLFTSTFGRLLTYPVTRVLLVARLVAAILLIVLPLEPGPGRFFLCGIVLTVSLALILRSQYGHDGADQMALVCFVCFVLAEGTGLYAAALWFVAGQSALAYLTAGVSKLTSPIWRSGKALPGILRTRIYGNEQAYLLIQPHTRVAMLASWAVIVLECAFPLALAGLPLLTGGLLAAGLLFHLANAVVMRLNTFFWSFIATYPAILYSAATVNAMRGQVFG